MASRAHRVQLSDRAISDVDGVLHWFASKDAASAGERWFAGLWKAIGTLESNPERCALAAENLGIPLRELLFGRRSGRYRILFIIEARTVKVLHIRHCARDAVTPDDLP